ncbi:hypothetical protein SNEBB_001970 [Seison nebaliae]|nr:hypothetical protein SNEBB_001970 [Seison nebaliae]
MRYVYFPLVVIIYIALIWTPSTDLYIRNSHRYDETNDNVSPQPFESSLLPIKPNLTEDLANCSSKFLFDNFRNNHSSLEDAGTWRSWKWTPSLCAIPEGHDCLEKYKKIAVLGDSYGNRYGDAVISHFRTSGYNCAVDRRYISKKGSALDNPTYFIRKDAYYSNNLKWFLQMALFSMPRNTEVAFVTSPPLKWKKLPKTYQGLITNEFLSVGNRIQYEMIREVIEEFESNEQNILLQRNNENLNDEINYHLYTLPQLQRKVHVFFNLFNVTTNKTSWIVDQVHYHPNYYSEVIRHLFSYAIC